jgi:hypothetical protein
MQLQAFVDDFALRVGQPQLRHRRHGGIEFAAQMQIDAVMAEHFADRRFRLAFGELELRVLEFDDLLAESRRSLT